MMGILGKCLRCGEKFELLPGKGLFDFCSPCRRVTGVRGLRPDRQQQANANWAFQRDRFGDPQAKPNTRSPFMEPEGTRPFVFMGMRFEKKVLK